MHNITTEVWATGHADLLETLVNRSELKRLMLHLIATERILEPELETPHRLGEFRRLLTAFLRDRSSDLTLVATRLESRLSPQDAVYRHSAGLFEPGWGARLLRRQLLRFYNQAVLRTLTDDGRHSVRLSGENVVYAACDLLEDLVDGFVRGLRLESRGIALSVRTVVPMLNGSMFPVNTVSVLERTTAIS
jgi:hypothetical protein